MPARHVFPVAVLALSAGAAQAEFRLHVLHINDLHSRIEPINAFDSICDAETEAKGECFGGAARLHAKINGLRDAIRAEGGNVIVLDAGDQFQGSLMFTAYRGAVEAEMMERIGFDAMALGNHEFGAGPEGLAAFLDTVSFPVLAGNVDVGGSNLLAGRLENHVVLEVGGERIGIVSALTVDTADIASPGPGVVFEDEVAALAADVAALEAEGVDKIIALTHVGLPRDIEIAEAVPGIDAVVGGHSHTYLSASDPGRQGAYPTWASREDGTLVPIVQAYAYSRYVGHLVLDFTQDGRLLHAGGDTVPLDARVEPDAEVQARVAELAAPIQALQSRPVGEATAAIDGSRESCRAVECEMGNLVADAMLDRVKDQGIQIAIANGGGLRASINAGTITMGEVLAVLPFHNTLATFQVTGEALRAALENGVSRVEEGAGRFPQVSGLRYTWQASAEAGARIRAVEVREGDAWVPLDPARVYGVVSNNFIRGGGDGYVMFVDAPNAYDYGPGLDQVLADFIAALGGAYTAYLDGRITRLE